MCQAQEIIGLINSQLGYLPLRFRDMFKPRFGRDWYEEVEIWGFFMVPVSWVMYVLWKLRIVWRDVR